ncbi:MAG: hypothetical protein AB1724_00930 [Thermodesulfobacteriota bacterium]
MRTLSVTFMCLLLAASVTAAPLSRQDVPDALRPWVEWALYGEQQDVCPIVFNDGEQAICAWPSFLTLDVQKSTAAFSQQWRVYAEDLWLTLPGGEGLWPQEVTVNGTAHPVGDRDGRPSVRISAPGEYTISGAFYFNRLPEWFRVPEQTGLIRLVVDGRPVAFPRLDREGRLWLRQEGDREAAAETQENRLQVRVHRLIQDDIPLRLITRLELSVSGRHREARLGQADTGQFTPMRIDSDLPVKIDTDGTLVAQVRPGKWTIEIVTRHQGPVSELILDAVGGFGADEEIWAFDARRHLRQVAVEGPAQVDPLQTTVPEEWRQYPVYVMTPRDKMSFVEKKRGDPQPAPDQLNLERTLWLNFDGGGVSIRDHISGTMTTGWRLEMGPPQELGRVTVNGQEQFITRLAGADKAGVEMRYGSVDLTAESRAETAGRLPVTGWDRDFQSVKGTLNLPPGWSLLHAAGIDNIRQTWLKQWELLDLFLVLIIAVAAARLRGWKWGAVCLITVVLINHEAGAPRWVWLHLLAAVALLRVLPKGRIRFLVDYYRLGALISLVVISLPFMVTQIRTGFYPQLEQPWQVMGPFGEQEETADVRLDKVHAMARIEAGMVAEQMAAPAPEASVAASYPGRSRQAQVAMVDTGAKIQTGPGIPNWNWRQVSFSWNGPVGRGEQMTFIFLSPGANLLLALARATLLAVMMFGLAGVGYASGRGFDFSAIRPGPAMALVLMVCVLAAVPEARSADTFPPDSLLQELKARLTDRDPPDCLPGCAASPRMKVVMDNTSLRIRMEIHGLSDGVAVPLPGSDQHWLPETVLVDDRPVTDLYRSPASGTLWLNVASGKHQVDLRGPLPRRQTVQLPLPLKPRYVEVQAEGWTVEGLHDNGAADDQLQFSRTGRDSIAAGESAGESFDPVLLPPFLEVTRTLSLGLTWRVDTRVRRLTPAGTAVVTAIPLLAGESVTTEIPVENGRVLLNLGPNQAEFEWSSTLEVADRLVLKAADTLDWTEAWNVNVGPIWHAEIQGIPVIHHQDRTGSWLPEWRPWPGEEVTINLNRPEGVGGQTHTIEKTRLTVRPGQRITQTELDMTIRSSRGSRQTVILPDQAVLQTVEINGASQAIRQSGRNVVLPLTPGQQEIRLTWRENRDLGWKWLTPAVGLGMASVDSFITTHMPRNRWVLLCGGPHVGPAVLFWSVVVVILLMSAGLGRLDVTPLRFRHWLLLALGLTQASLLIALPVAAWFLAMGYRKRAPDRLPGFVFNLTQIALAGLSVAAMSALLFGIKQGLLGYPDMQIAGNGSGNYLLNWYQDISGDVLPRAWVFSLPIIVYRILILLWALWLALAVVTWLKWAWECYSAGGLWRPVEWRGRFAGKGEPAVQTPPPASDLDLDLPEDETV